jgi:hypothetical protein
MINGIRTRALDLARANTGGVLGGDPALPYASVA